MVSANSVPFLSCTPTDGPAKEELQARQPGNDGGVFQRRFEKRKVPDLAANGIDEATTRTVLTDLLEIYVMKVAGRLSESDVENILTHSRACYRRLRMGHIADVFPLTCGAMMTLLEQWSVVSWDTEVAYKQCTCGFVYRNNRFGDYREASICPICECPK